MSKWETVEAPLKRKDIEGEHTGMKTITERMKVRGGWLVRTLVRDCGGAVSVSVSMVFLSDEDHQWKIG